MIIGINLKSINANINKIKKQINIQSHSKILGIEKRDINFYGMKNIIFINFDFQTIYNPDIGNINIRGEILYKDPENKILEKWNNEKKLDEKIAPIVMNAIFRKCLTKAISIAADLNLPPPIAFPKIRPIDNERKFAEHSYIG